MTNQALERAVFRRELPPCPSVSPGSGSQPGFGVPGGGGGCRVYRYRLYRLERVGTSGELFLCVLQMCPCPKPDRSAQIPGFTARETRSKCTDGETFVKWIFLPLFSVPPRCTAVGRAVAEPGPCPCPGCPGGALAAPRYTTMHRDTPQSLCHRSSHRSAEAQLEPGENEALI